MTAVEFLELHGDESRIELVAGDIVELQGNGCRIGVICGNVVGLIGGHIKAFQLGRAACNHTFICTTLNPDSVRALDFVYISYDTLPADVPTPSGAITPPLELVVEVRSPTDSVLQLTNKATEYLEAGVKVVVILDPRLESAAVFRAEEFPQRFHNGDEFTLPDVLPGFAVPVKAFFE